MLLYFWNSRTGEERGENPDLPLFELTRSSEGLIMGDRSGVNSTLLILERVWVEGGCGFGTAEYSSCCWGC